MSAQQECNQWTANKISLQRLCTKCQKVGTVCCCEFDDNGETVLEVCRECCGPHEDITT